MNITSRRILLASLMATLALPVLATRAVPDFRVNAVEERKNATLNFTQGGGATLGKSKELNGLMATTSDFKNTPTDAFIVFADSVPQEKIEELMDKHGRLSGSVQCKRIRLGSSPEMPGIKIAVLAQDCTINKIN